MDIKSIKNRWTQGLALSTLLWAAGTALGQTPAADSPPHSAPLGIGGFVSPTPEEQAAFDLQCQLEYGALQEFYDGQFAQVEADARQALATCKTDSGMGWELLGWALDAQGKDREALQVYSHIVEQGGGPFDDILLPYALLQLKAGRWAPAVAAYNLVLPDVTSSGDALHPNTPPPPDGHTPLVADLLRESSHFSADTPEPRALATAVHIALGLRQIGIAAQGTPSQKDRALAHFQAALTLSPDSDVANYYYGYGLQKLGLTQQAKAAFQKTVKMARGEVKAAALRALKGQKKPA